MRLSLISVPTSRIAPHNRRSAERAKRSQKPNLDLGPVFRAPLAGSTSNDQCIRQEFNLQWITARCDHGSIERIGRTKYLPLSDCEYQRIHFYIMPGKASEPPCHYFED